VSYSSIAFLYPSDPIHIRQVDESYRDEFYAARRAGLAVHCFDIVSKNHGCGRISYMQGEESGDISTAITTYKNGVNDMASHQWQQTIFIDTALAAKLIQQQMAFEVKNIVEMGKGWDNIAYLVNEQYVFRFPRRAMGVECLQNEIQALPYLAEHVSFSFTHPEFVGTPSQEYQSPFAGYPMLPGVQLSEMPAKSVTSTSFAKKLAQWLKELHTIPVRQEDHTAIKGDQNWRYNVSQRSDKVMKSLERYASYFQDAGFEISQLITALEYFKPYDFEHIARTSYCHGDLYSRHILVDENHEPSGLIDWGDVHIGHPGIDLSVGFMIFADDALSIFLKEYSHVDSSTYAMALFRTFWHPIALLPYCYEEKEERLKGWAVLALSRAIAKINERRI